MNLPISLLFFSLSLSLFPLAPVVLEQGREARGASGHADCARDEAGEGRRGVKRGQRERGKGSADRARKFL